MTVTMQLLAISFELAEAIAPGNSERTDAQLPVEDQPASYFGAGD